MLNQDQIFYLLIGFYIAYRLIEMGIDKKNYKQLLNYYGELIEMGSTQRKLMILLHSSWFISLMTEYYLRPNINETQIAFISLFALTISAFLRTWSMKSLGMFWSTKIFNIKGRKIVATGPYQFFPYPNYLAVVIEFIFIPLIFKLYFTLLVFSLLNIIFLYFRIKLQNHSHQL